MQESYFSAGGQIHHRHIFFHGHLLFSFPLFASLFSRLFVGIRFDFVNDLLLEDVVQVEALVVVVERRLRQGSGWLSNWWLGGGFLWFWSSSFSSGATKSVGATGTRLGDAPFVRGRRRGGHKIPVRFVGDQQGVVVGNGVVVNNFSVRINSIIRWKDNNPFVSPDVAIGVVIVEVVHDR